MKRAMYPILIVLCLLVLLLPFPSVSSAGKAPRILYMNTTPSDLINITNYEVRIIETNSSNKTVCFSWSFHITSQVEGATPFKIDFYDQDRKLLGHHEEVVDLQHGTTNVNGHKWLSCPEYFAHLPKPSSAP